MTEKFDLSEKIDREIDREPHILVKDVKEFIGRLKESFHNDTDLGWDKIVFIIDKLAGEKLTK